MNIHNSNYIVYNKNKYILDPHTAIGLGAAKKLKINNCIVLATAHPAKFPDAIIKSINQLLYRLILDIIQVKNENKLAFRFG